jgi:uncharacterized damage-inducible protein DinB
VDHIQHQPFAGSKPAVTGSASDGHIKAIIATHRFFRKSTGCFREEHSGFAPAPGMFTAAQQVAHAAQVVEWFLGGAFDSATGFDMDFEAHERDVRRCTSLAEAFGRFDRAFLATEGKLRGCTPEYLAEPIPNDRIMGGAPRMAVVSAIADHTAHHRGALVVYARLLGLVPPMPYAE